MENFIDSLSLFLQCARACVERGRLVSPKPKGKPVTNSWTRAKINWISKDLVFAFATSERRYEGDVLLRVELYTGVGAPFAGRKPGDTAVFSTVMDIDGKKLPKEWKWAQ